MQNRTLHLVHVGKCAGESVTKALEQHGLPFTEHHCGLANVEIADQVLTGEENDLFVILIRDPVSRFVSAFEWDLLEKFIARDKPQDNPLWLPVYDTFDSANSLAEALTSPNADLRSVADHAMRSSHLHMHFDLAWYLPPQIAERLSRKNAFAIRTEHINDDFAGLLGRMGVPMKDGFSVPFSKNNYKSRIPEHRRTDKLSDLAARNVRSYSLASYETMLLLRRSGILVERGRWWRRLTLSGWTQQRAHRRWPTVRAAP
jgi:hypothetical protein